MLASPRSMFALIAALTLAAAPSAAHAAGTTSPSSDLVISATSPSGRVGDVVTSRLTVRNMGPSAQPWWGLSDLYLPSNTKLVALQGCTDGVIQGAQVECAFTAPLEVGHTKTITVKMRITAAEEDRNGKGGGGFNVYWYANPDPDYGNNASYFEVHVKGGAATPSAPATTKPSTPKPVTSSSSRPARPKPTPARTRPSAASPSASASSTPSPVAPVASPKPLASPATVNVASVQQDRNALAGPAVNLAIAAVILGLGSLAGRRIGRRQSDVD